MMLPAMALRRLFSSRSISLRSQLTVLVLATLIPLLIFSGLVLYLLAQRERNTFEHGVKDRARAVLTAVDTELKSSITTLQALASLSHFDRDDLQSFREEALHVLGNEPNWLTINLAIPSGRQVMNLQRSSDAILAMTRERRSLDQTLRTAKPVVGDMLQSAVTHTQQFSLRVPIIRNGVTKYILSAVIDPQSIYQLLLAQKLPPDWIGVVLDANRHLVGETVSAEQNVGQPASTKQLEAALDRASEGWFQSRTDNGSKLYTAYSRSSFSGWTVALVIPAYIVSAPFRGPVLYLLLCGIVLLIVGSFFASWLSSKTAASIEALVRMVKDLGLGKVSAAAANEQPSNLAEIEQLKDTFLTARRLIQERSEERDRLEEALHQDITQRTRAERFLLLQIAASRALADSADLAGATPKIVQAICELTGWEVGFIWEIDRKAGELKSIEVWHAPAANMRKFVAANRKLRFASGVGLAGRVWASGEAVWIPDIAKDSNFLRAVHAPQEGLHTAVGFPIRMGTEVLGVIECFSHEIREPDTETLETLTNIGIQLGQFIDRKRAEHALAESMRRKDALYQFLDRRQRVRSLGEMYDAALDGIFSALRCERAAILLQDASGVSRFVASRGLSDAYRKSVEGHSPWKPDETDPQPISISDIAAAELDDFLKAALTDEGVEALAFIPMIVNGRLAGKLMIYYNGPHAFDDIELQLSLTIARQLAHGIERKRAEDEIAQLNEELERRVAARTRELQQANATLLHDMEERKRLEEQLLQSQKMESIGTLAGGVAHDFNNILNIIQAYASVLTAHGAESDEISDSVTVIKDTVKRGSALVQQLLTLARKSGGPALEPINLNTLVEGMLPLIKKTFPKTIEVSCALEPELRPTMADKNQIEQALLNLSVNARDAMPNGGRLTFKTQSVDAMALQHLANISDGDYVCIEVSDSGVGIDENIRERIFEPFFTTKDTSQGTGLGLSVVYGIVKNHNGFVDVESNPMTGTSFRLYFPAALVTSDDKQPVEETAAETTATDNGAETILIAEDEANMLHLLEKIFSRRGYKVLTASNGQTALDIYQRHKEEIAVVFLDMGLPKISGRDVLRQMKSENCNVKVIVTSGYIEAATKSEIDYARVKFLHKPYTPEDVFKTLGSLLETA